MWSVCTSKLASSTSPHDRRSSGEWWSSSRSSLKNFDLSLIPSLIRLHCSCCGCAVVMLLCLHQTDVSTRSRGVAVCRRAVIAAEDARMERQQVQEFEQRQDNDERLHHFLQGYQSVIELKKTEHRTILYSLLRTQCNLTQLSIRQWNCDTGLMIGKKILKTWMFGSKASRGYKKLWHRFVRWSEIALGNTISHDHTIGIKSLWELAHRFDDLYRIRKENFECSYDR